MRFLKNIFSRELSFVFLCPAVLWQIVFLYVPLALLFLYTIIVYQISTQSYELSFEFYRKVLSSSYFKVILRSFLLATATSLVCFIIAYPVSYYLGMSKIKRFKNILLLSLILPSWTSLIIQVYAWFFLLEKNSFICRILVFLGVLSPHSHLLNSYFSIMIGMVSCYLPFMILPIYVVIEKMDKEYLEASADLGANRFETFRNVVFPLSLPGVYAGLLLVFIPSFGEFAIPTLLGGSKYMFWGSVIVDKFLRSRDWQSGAAFAMVGVVFVLLIIVLYGLISLLIKRLMVRRRRISCVLKKSVSDGGLM